MESIIVTGASTGIGYATALRLAESGALVFAGVRKEADRERMSAVHANIRPIILDVTVRADVVRAVDVVRASGSPLRAIVNNAGIAVAGPLEFLPVEALRNQFEVNVIGPIALTQAALPLLRETSGRVVFIGSIASRLSAPFVGPYSASKSALASLADALRQELAPFGISVSLLEFASVKTPIWQKGRDGKDRLIESMPPHALHHYGELVNAIVRQTRREEHEGMEPGVIADTVLDAIQSPRPRERYVIGRKARIQAMAALLPPRARDALVKRVMQLP
ncbi:MAG: SDR family NAD(P)-dependent oxidoreductase [Candidatus Eremiobacteraeota bacterium]|nr:SDR family NAD(P)-dependent oxidoreductase [Candidatus Eremiobacteraeota bacterium]